MAYIPKTDWKDYPDLSTPVKSVDFIRIEEGIAEAEAEGVAVS